MKSDVVRRMKESARIIEQMAEDGPLVASIGLITQVCVAALKKGNKLLFMGNGGSAADAQHLAAELVSRFAFDRPGLAAIALTVDTSVLTAIGNDYGYGHVFSRQIEALGRPGDVLIGISTSGKSPNVMAGLEKARQMGLITVGMTGSHGERITQLVDYMIEIPSRSTPQIQEGHILIGHIICGAIEEQMFGAGSCAP